MIRSIKLLTTKAALDRNVYKWSRMTGRQMWSPVTLWIIHRRGLIHHSVPSIKMDASCCYVVFFVQSGGPCQSTADDTRPRVVLQDWRGLRGNGSTDFKQSSGHACTKPINYLPPAHTVGSHLAKHCRMGSFFSLPPPPHPPFSSLQYK